MIVILKKWLFPTAEEDYEKLIKRQSDSVNPVRNIRLSLILVLIFTTMLFLTNYVGDALNERIAIGSLSRDKALMIGGMYIGVVTISAVSNVFLFLRSYLDKCIVDRYNKSLDIEAI